MHSFAVSWQSGLSQVVDSAVMFLLAKGWFFPHGAAGPADVELLGFCELLKKILLRKNLYPWHSKNPAWLYSPLVRVLNFNTLVATLGSHQKRDNNVKSSWNTAIARRDDCFKAWCERNYRYVLIFKQLHSSQQGPFATELFRITLFVIEQSSNLEMRRPTKMRNWDFRINKDLRLWWVLILPFSFACGTQEHGWHLGKALLRLMI